MSRLGYIKDHRQELDSDIWIMPPLYHRVWQYLKYEANHADNEIPMANGEKFTVKKGQRLTSYRNIASSIGWYEGLQWKVPNPKTIKTICDWLERNNMIKQEHGKGNRQYTLISIVNWELYQCECDDGVTDKQQGADINKNDKNDNIDNNKLLSCPNSKFSDESIEVILSKELYSLMLNNNPKAKKPNFQTWAKSIDLMLRVDKRTVDEIRRVMVFSQKDNFWFRVILSTSKLREKFDTLSMKADAMADKAKKEVISRPNAAAYRHEF